MCLHIGDIMIAWSFSPCCGHQHIFKSIAGPLILKIPISAGSFWSRLPNHTQPPRRKGPPQFLPVSHETVDKTAHSEGARRVSYCHSFNFAIAARKSIKPLLRALLIISDTGEREGSSVDLGMTRVVVFSCALLHMKAVSFIKCSFFFASPVLAPSPLSSSPRCKAASIVCWQLSTHEVHPAGFLLPPSSI